AGHVHNSEPSRRTDALVRDRGASLKQLIFSLLVLSVASIDVVAAPNEPPANTVAATQAADQGTAPKPVLAETARLSENLIYSVNRTPERPFDTARSVEVITSDEIAR